MRTASLRQRWAMISSTALDLPEHRKAVIDACNRARVSPIAMEHLPARDADAVRVSMEMVDQADVYLGIFASRYGYVPEGHDASITELEFNRAIARQIPILVFVAHGDHLFKSEEVEADAVAQGKLRALKECASRNRVRATFRSAEELGARAFQALIEWRLQVGDTAIGDNLEHRPNAVAVAVPHELEPPPADFTGREHEIQGVLAAIGDQHRPVLVYGMAGVGKSCLASAVAGRIADRFPDGQIVIDMRGADESPRDPVEAITRVLSLVAPHLQPKHKDLESIRKDYLSALYGKRVLLLLDNAASAKQVEPLVPPAGSLMLMTSRCSFRIPGASAPLELSVLTDRAAVEFLTSVVPTAAPVAAEVARLCGRLPLALRLATSAMAERPDVPPAAYLKRLADEGRRQKELAPVFHSIGLSFRLLGPEAQPALLELSTFPDAFDRAAAAAVWGLGDLVADERIGQFIRFALLGWSPQTERYSLHDLVREFCVQHIDPAHAEVARQRHAVHFEHVLGEAEQLYFGHSDAQRRGIALVSRERPNIAAGIHWAMDRSDTEPDVARLCCRYPETGLRVMHATDWPSRELWAKCLEIARRTGDRRVESLALRRLYFRSPEERVERKLEALAIAREIGDRVCEGSALQALANEHVELGKPEDARRFAEESLTIARTLDDPRLEAFAVRSLGSAYQALGKPDLMFECFRRRREIARSLGDFYSEAVALGYMVDALKSQGRVTEAVDHALVAADIYHELTLHQAEFDKLLTACIWLRGRLGRAREALALTERMRGIAPMIPGGSQTCSVQSGLAHLELGNLPAAAEAFETCAGCAESVGLQAAFMRGALSCRADVGDREGVARVLNRLQELGGPGVGWAAGGEPVQKILGDHALDRRLSMARRLDELFSSGASLAAFSGPVLDTLTEAVQSAAGALAALPAPRRAIALYRLASDVGGERGADRLRRSFVNSMAILHVQVGDLDSAMELFSLFLEDSMRQGNLVNEILAKCNQADVLTRLQRRDEAVHLTRQVVTRCAAELERVKEQGSDRWRLEYLLSLARENLGGALLLQPKEMEEAATLLTAAIETLRRLKKRDHEAEILCNLARIALQKGDPARAVDLCSSAVAIAVEAESFLQEADSRWVLGEAHLANGDVRAACEQLSKVVDYERAIEHTKADEHAAFVERLRKTGPA